MQVVYFHQGHRIYVESVQAKKLHPVHKSTIPWQKYVLMPQELCQVTNVRYSVGPPTLCCITLTLLQPFNKSAEEEEGGDSDTAYRMTNDGSSKGGQRDRIRFSFRWVMGYICMVKCHQCSCLPFKTNCFKN